MSDSQNSFFYPSPLSDTAGKMNVHQGKGWLEIVLYQSGELDSVSGDSRDMKKNVHEQGDGCSGSWSWGSEGYTLHHVSVLLLSLKKNIYQSINFLVTTNQHPQETYTDASQLHVEMHPAQTGSRNLRAGRHCTAEFIVHMYSLCRKIKAAHITARTFLIQSLGLVDSCSATGPQERSSISKITLKLTQYGV